MAYPETNKESSYSWINIILIAICGCIFAYSVYYFSSSSDQPKLQDEYIEEELSNDSIVDNKKEQEQEQEEEMEEVENDADIGEELASLEEPTDTNFFIDDTVPEVVEPTALDNIDKFSDLDFISNYLIPDDLLRSTIVFIDNFSRGDFIVRFSPITAPRASFTVEKQDNNKLYIDPISYERYDDYTLYIESIDSKLLIESYIALQSIINDTYAEISRPGVNFLLPLNQAIEVVLSTPVIHEAIELKSPSVMYVFADPELEKLNDAQKLMLRFGPNNLNIIKHKLRVIQIELETLDR